MTKEEKLALSKEMLINMDLTKEQYMEMCRLCDELDLGPVPKDPEDCSWDDIIEQAENNEGKQE